MASGGRDSRRGGEGPRSRGGEEFWGRTFRSGSRPPEGAGGGDAEPRQKLGGGSLRGAARRVERVEKPKADAEESRKLLAEEGRNRAAPPASGPRSRLSSNMRELLDDRYGEAADEVIAKTFLEIDKWLGKEFLADDTLEHALMVKTRTLDSCVCLASVLTLGLYYFFRPMKDMALLALTGSGRVILVRREHSSIFGSSAGTKLWILLRFLLVLLALVLVPAVVWTWLSMNGFGEQLRDGVALVMDHPEAKELRKFFADQTKVYASLVVLFWIVFVVWVWVHRQRGYGARYKREFKASSIAAAQYVCTDSGGFCNLCCRRRRNTSLRLYFGKYPTKRQLNEDLSSSVPAASAVGPLQYASGGVSDMVGGKQGTPQDPDMDEENQDEVVRQYFPCVSLMLLICSLVAQGFTFASYVRELQWVLQASSYCEVGKACTPGLCRKFAAEHEFNRPQFCDYVRWVSDELTCQGDMTCCTGCVSGEVLVFLGGNDPLAWMGTVNAFLNYCTLLLALFASSVIVRHAFGKAAETACLDIEFVQDFFQPSSALFQMRSELATDFLNRVFQGATLKASEAPAPLRSEIPLQSRDEGVLASRNWLPDNVELVRKSDAPNWQSFFVSGYRLVTPGLFGAVSSKVRVPTQCLGFMKDEIVLRAWTETPFLTHKEFWYTTAGAVSCAISLAYWPRSWGGPLISYPGARECDEGFREDEEVLGPKPDMLTCAITSPLLVLLLTCLALPFLLGVRYLTFYSAQQCAVIVTTQRVFSVYFRPNWQAAIPYHICEPGMALRVEVFRHGGQIFYGRMNSQRPPWFQRLFSRYPWTTGEVVMQSRRGVLSMERMMGSVDELYDLVATRLSKDLDDLNIKNDYKYSQLPMTYGVQDGSVATESRTSDMSSLTWTSAVPGDPSPEKAVAVAAGREEPVYIWSFQDSGPFTSPYLSFNDVVVTTDRIRLRSRVGFKSFDCRACCCWGVFFCACLRRLVSPAHLPVTRSFLNFSHLAAFSTETSVSPRSVPLECPCFSALCACVNAIFHCSGARCPSLRDFVGLPGTAAPRVQLWLKWLQRNGRAVRPDLVLSAKPYKLREFAADASEDEEVGLACDSDEDGCCGRCGPRERRRRPVDAEEVEQLRALMQLVLHREERRREGLSRRPSVEATADA